MATVYILKSEKNGSYYIGSTEDLERRFEEHNTGNTKATKFLKPLSIVFSQEYVSIEDAREIENKLKKLKSRKIIEKIILEGYIKMEIMRS